jgi:Hypoxia induced protein conserved region
MSSILIPVVIILMGLTVVTLVRGIIAFLQTTREELDRPEGSGPSAMQLQQNKLMFRRIIYQAAAILVVALLVFASRD